MTNDAKSLRNFRKFKKGPIVLALAFLILDCTALFFVFREINKTKAAAEETVALWKAAAQKQDEMKALQILLTNLSEERAALGSHFAASSNVVPFLDTLEKLGRAAGASPEVLSVETPGDKSILVVTLAAEGSFEAVYKFLQLLENSPYPLEISAFDLGRVSEEDPSLGWEGLFKMRLLTFIP